MTDPYVDSRGVLKNKLNIKDYEELKQAEADIGFLKLISLESLNIEEFDEEFICKIHKHIFEDIFEWAGEYRTVPLVKEEVVLPGLSLQYSDYKNIPRELHQHLLELNRIAWQNRSKEEIAKLFARKIALLWRVHPFRDGNTRTTLSFASLYAKEHGFPLDMNVFINHLSRKYKDDKIVSYSIRDLFVLASLDEKDYPEVEPLASIISAAMVLPPEGKVKS